MFMSWASPRSIPGSLGLSRFSKRTAADKGSGFWSKFCYSCAIVILATILWVWAVIIHHIYNNRNVDSTTKWFYIIGATFVSVVIFIVIVYITMSFRPPRRQSTQLGEEGDGGLDGNHHHAHDNQNHHQESHSTKSADVVSPV